MKNVQLLEEAPFSRIAIPLAIGIAAQEAFPNIFIIPAYIIGLFFLGFHIYTLSRIELRFRYKHLFAYATVILLFALGCTGMLLTEHNSMDNTLLKDNKYALAHIDGKISSSKNSIGAEATLTNLFNRDNKPTTVNEPIILRLEKDSAACSLQQGDIVLFTQHIAPIANKANPEAFDYASLMRHKGYIYTQYLPAGQWKIAGKKQQNSFKGKAERQRDKYLAYIDQGGFTPESIGLLKALLLGYTEEVSDAQRATFSTAGLSHILAVSGLHTGIIWVVLSALFAPLLWFRQKRLHALAILVCIWIYAFITGLSPSVIRACVMVTIVLIGTIITRKPRPLNSLFVAATIMLLYNPHYLFQVGFQLSFLSVLAILYLYTPLYHTWNPYNKILRKMWSLLCVSIVAQIGTLPLVIYYFHEFPLLGLLTNIIVVPLLPILLFCGFLWLILASCGIQIELLREVLNYSTYGLNEFTDIISSFKYASIRDIWFEPHILILWCGVIIGGITWLLSRQTKVLISTLFFALGLLIFDIVAGHRPIHNGWVVYQESRSTTLNFIDNGNNLLLPLDTISQRTIEHESERFRLRNNLENVAYITDNATHDHLRIRLPYITFFNERIIILDDDRWINTNSHTRMSIDYGIICPGFKGKIDNVRQVLDIRQIILSYNLPYFQQKHLEEECERLRIPCHRIRTDGAWVKELKIE